jgi:hypothetical protein
MLEMDYLRRSNVLTPYGFWEVTGLVLSLKTLFTHLPWSHTIDL